MECWNNGKLESWNDGTIETAESPCALCLLGDLCGYDPGLFAEDSVICSVYFFGL